MVSKKYLRLIFKTTFAILFAMYGSHLLVVATDGFKTLPVNLMWYWWYWSIEVTGIILLYTSYKIFSGVLK